MEGGKFYVHLNFGDLMLEEFEQAYIYCLYILYALR